MMRTLAHTHRCPGWLGTDPRQLTTSARRVPPMADKTPSTTAASVMSRGLLS